MRTGTAGGRRRSYPLLFAGVIGLILGALAPVATQAATPASGSIDGSKPVAWDFAPVVGTTVLGGTGGEQVCPTGECDNFDLTVKLPAATPVFYTDHTAKLFIKYTWTSNAPADLDVFAISPSGATSGPGTPDDTSTGKGEEDLTVTNPESGLWHIRSVGSLNAEPIAAHAVATLSFALLPGAVTQLLVPDDPLFVNYESPSGFEGRDILLRPDAGEPSIGVNWKTGAVLYFGGNQVARITFDDSRHPATAKWVDVTPPKQQYINEDPILFTDHDTGRTFSVGLLLACSNVDYSDDDGSTWLPSTGCPIPHSPDHETLASGPYAKTGSLKPTGTYPHIVYYCSQNILQAAGAFCGHSEDGGVTFDTPSTLIFGQGTPCRALHGHIRIAPDGTAYVPQNTCTIDSSHTGQGMAVTKDNGVTYTYSVVPDSTSGSGSDPSVVAGANNTVYYGYINGASRPEVAVSHDHGAHWLKSIDVGSAIGIKNSVFPEIMAGDDNRAALTFIGTNTPGERTATGFQGTWYLYVAYTYDGGKSWVTINATPNDPVQRGCIAGGGSCRNMLDFNEISVDKIGRVVVSYTDGCTADCETNPRIDQSGCPGAQGEGTSENSPIDSTSTCTYGRHSAMVRQDCGKGLFAANDGALGSACYPNGQPATVTTARSTGGGNPTTGTIGPESLGFGLLGAAALGAAAALVEGRRRRRNPVLGEGARGGKEHG